MITITNLEKTFEQPGGEQVHALRGIDLSLPEGQYLYNKAKLFRESIVSGAVRAAQAPSESEPRSAASTDGGSDIPF